MTGCTGLPEKDRGSGCGLLLDPQGRHPPSHRVDPDECEAKDQQEQSQVLHGDLRVRFHDRRVADAVADRSQREPVLGGEQ